MFVVQFEYEIEGAGFVESCEGLDMFSEDHVLCHTVIDEIFIEF